MLAHNVLLLLYYLTLNDPFWYQVKFGKNPKEMYWTKCWYYVEKLFF